MFKILDQQGRYISTVIGGPMDLGRVLAQLKSMYPEDQPMTIEDLGADMSDDR